MSREEELNARIREVPLAERLHDSRSRIAKMCSTHRPPRMTIPVQWDDDDYFICLTLKDAMEEIAQLRRDLAEARAYIIEYHRTDYACAECNPGGETVLLAFVCQYHKAAKKD